MAIWKMILRDGDNPETSKLHVIEKYCEAPSKRIASEIFDKAFGPSWVVAGPLKVEENKVPTGVEIIKN